MKPSITKWVYLGMAYLALSCSLEIATGLVSFKGFETTTDNSHSYLPVTSIIVIVASIVAIVGLTRRIIWARTAALVAISVESVNKIGLNMYALYLLYFNKNFYISESSLVFSIFSGILPLVLGILVGVALVWLAYNIYSSKPLRDYLSTPPHTTA